MFDIDLLLDRGAFNDVIVLAHVHAVIDLPRFGNLYGLGISILDNLLNILPYVLIIGLVLMRYHLPGSNLLTRALSAATALWGSFLRGSLLRCAGAVVFLGFSIEEHDVELSIDLTL